MILDYKDFTDLIEQFAGELPELLASPALAPEKRHSA